MALAIDASTPAATTISHTVPTNTTASFSPPASSVIFAFFAQMGDSNEDAQVVSSITDSLGTHLTWSLYTGSRDNIGGNTFGGTEVWWASCPSSQTSMTVTATFSHNNNQGFSTGGMFQLVVFTGAATSQTGNASIRNSSATGTPSQTLTTSASNSWVFGLVQNCLNATGPTDGSSQTNTFNGHSAVQTNATDSVAFWVQATTAPTSASGTVVTINDTAPTSIAHHFSMVEVLAAGGGGGGSGISVNWISMV